MFHGEGEIFGEGVEESEVGFCAVFISEGSTSVVDKVRVELRRRKGQGTSIEPKSQPPVV